MASLQEMLQKMVEKGASDLHITTNSNPRIRIAGELHPLENSDVLTSTDTKILCYNVLTESQKRKFEEDLEIDFSFGIKGLSRFRANIFMQRGTVAGVFRGIPYKIKNFDELGIPEIVRGLCMKPKGLVLVTGPTGSWKSSTLAAMLDKINTESHGHIVTIEDPIEYLHSHKNCVVNQREIGADSSSFKSALKSILRQDPDYVLIGEMRDLETVQSALAIAETGHLVFGTLHTGGAVQTIHRILDFFPPHQQAHARAELSSVLEGVISQALIPKADGSGEALATEIMIPTPAIRTFIKEDKLNQIYPQIRTMNQSLQALCRENIITAEDAMKNSSDIDELKQLLNGKN